MNRILIAAAFSAVITSIHAAPERPAQADPVPPIVWVMAKVEWKWNKYDGFVSPFWDAVVAEQQGFVKMLEGAEAEHNAVPGAIKDYLNRLPMNKISEERKALAARPVCKDGPRCVLCCPQWKTFAEQWTNNIQKQVDDVNARTERLHQEGNERHSTAQALRKQAEKNKVTVRVSNIDTERVSDTRVQVQTVSATRLIPDPALMRQADNETSQGTALIDKGNGIMAGSMDIYKALKPYWSAYYDQKHVPAGYGQLPQRPAQ